MNAEVAIPPLVRARRVATAWLNGDRIASGGFIVVYGEDVQGWTQKIDRARCWKPGCIAVPVFEGEKCFLATGGTEREGASQWEAISS